MLRLQFMAGYIKPLVMLALVIITLLAGLQLALAADPISTGIGVEPPGNALDFKGTGNGDELLQFTSAGHVLGFTEDGVIVASASHMLKTEFLNANAVAPEADGEVSGEESTGIASPLGRVTYRDVWDGVTVVYEASEGAIVKSTYHLDATESGVPVDSIRLSYNRPVCLDEQDNLVIAYENGNLVESAPVAWQEIDGQKKPVSVAYALYGEREVGFSLGDYVPGIPVVIDPCLTWNTFLGGSGTDYGRGIAVDGSGNVYVTGYGNATWGSPVRPYTSGYDAFAAKLYGNGTLLWNTFLGGSGSDIGYGIAVDGSGNVSVSGYSSATWGSPVRAYYGSGDDAFAAKLYGNGTLTWNTFLGGSGNDFGYGIAVDGSGNVSVAGYSTATWGSPVRAYTVTGGADAFAAKLYGNGSLLWNTFLGGTGYDYGYGIAVDGSGNVYVAGYSGDTWGSPVQAYTGGADVFAAKLYGNGSLTWNTFLGGNGTDYGYGIAVDGSGNVSVSGYSSATWGSPVRAYTVTGGADAFAAKLDGNGTLLWNTFLGGTGYDYGYGIAVDGSGNVYVVGYSGATWGSPVRAYTGGADAFAAKLDSSGSLLWNTFVGGSGNDYGYGIAVDGSGNVYVAGYSDATWGSPVQAYYGSGNDAFAAKVDCNQYTLTYTPGAHGNITGTTPQTVDYLGNGSAVTAVSDTGYHFLKWSDNVLTASRTDTNVTGNITVEASFAINYTPIYYTFLLTYTAEAHGSISGTSPQMVNYGGSGTSVTAVPGAGSHFLKWSDGSTVNPRRDTNVTANVSVTASFAINQYTLTYTAGAHGSISGTSPQTVNYGGSGLAVTAVPGTGYHFMKWSDGSTANPRRDTDVTSDISVTARFAINTYTLTYMARAYGSISGANPQIVNYGGSGLAVTAVSGAASHFLKWSDGSTVNPRRDTDVTSDISVTASFAINTYTLTYTAGAHGSISGTTPQTVSYGEDGTAVTVVSDTGYEFVQWSDGSTDNPRTDADVTADIIVEASFAINTDGNVTPDIIAEASFAINSVVSGGLPAPVTPKLEVNVMGNETSAGITTGGVLTETVNVTSQDRAIELELVKDTKALDSYGNPLSKITIEVATEVPDPPEGVYTVGFVIDCGPDGATFAPPITLTIHYDPATLVPGIDENELQIAYWNSTQWVLLPSIVDTTTHTVSASISHFTDSAVMASLSKATPIATPTPAPTPTPTPIPAATLTSELTPTPPVPTPIPPAASTPLNVWLIVGIIAALIIIGLAAWQIVLRRKNMGQVR